MKLYYLDSTVTIRQIFFSVSVIQLWNKLPEEVVSASQCFYIACKFDACVLTYLLICRY